MWHALYYLVIFLETAGSDPARSMSLQKIPVPLNGDEGAVRKYAEEVEALKRKASVASHLLLLPASLMLDVGMEAAAEPHSSGSLGAVCWLMTWVVEP